MIEFNSMKYSTDNPFPKTFEEFLDWFPSEEACYRWLGGTHQGAVTPGHLSGYLDEFAFRFNRRLSAHRGKLFYRLMQQAVAATSPKTKDLYVHR